MHLDPMESGKVHVESFAELIRRRKQLDQPTLQYLEAIFFYLSSNGSEEVENTRLITSCHVEHHKDVLSGRQSGAEVLITFLTALKDTKIVTLKDFLTLNMYAKDKNLISTAFYVKCVNDCYIMSRRN